MAIKVSIIVPNLHSPTVCETLKSLRGQDYPGEFEIIVVGQDRYGQVEEVERTRFIVTPEPVSPAIARNIGIREARGDIIVFTDADCIARPDWLARLTKPFQNPNVRVVGGGVSFPDKNYWTMCDNLASFYPYLSSGNPGFRDELPSLNLSVRKSALEQVGNFDERYPAPAGEDADLTTRLRLQGNDLHFVPDAIINHHPRRKYLADMFKHSYQFGRYSIRVDHRYQDILNVPWPLKNWWATLLFSPLLAGGVTLRVIGQIGWKWRWWLALPVVFFAKVSWCIGASRTLREGSPLETKKTE